MSICFKEFQQEQAEAGYFSALWQGDTGIKENQVKM